MARGTYWACGFLSNGTPRGRALYHVMLTHTEVPAKSAQPYPSPCCLTSPKENRRLSPTSYSEGKDGGPAPQLGSDAWPFLPPHLCRGRSLHLEWPPPAPPAFPPVLCGLAQTHASSRDLCLLNSAHLVPTDSCPQTHTSLGRGPVSGLTAPSNKSVALTLFLEDPAPGSCP